MRFLRRLALASALALGPHASLAASNPAAIELCRHVTQAEASFVVCTVDLTRYALKTFLRAADGAPYGGFDRLVQSPKGQGLVFAMNGGMYDKDEVITATRLAAN